MHDPVRRAGAEGAVAQNLATAAWFGARMKRALGSKRAWGLVLVLGGALPAALTAAWTLPHFGLGEHFSRPVASAPRPNHIFARLEDGTALVMPYQSAAPAPPEARGCGFGPMVPAASRHDGQYRLVDASGQRLPRAAAYLKVASEAAAAGRSRDSEVALIMACRVATGPPAPQEPGLRRIHARLASLYRRQARAAGDASMADAFRQRAQALLEAGAAAGTTIWKTPGLAQQGA